MTTLKVHFSDLFFAFSEQNFEILDTFLWLNQRCSTFNNGSWACIHNDETGSQEENNRNYQIDGQIKWQKCANCTLPHPSYPKIWQLLWDTLSLKPHLHGCAKKIGMASPNCGTEPNHYSTALPIYTPQKSRFFSFWAWFHFWSAPHISICIFHQKWQINVLLWLFIVL